MKDFLPGCTNFPSREVFPGLPRPKLLLALSVAILFHGLVAGIFTFFPAGAQTVRSFDSPDPTCIFPDEEEEEFTVCLRPCSTAKPSPGPSTLHRQTNQRAAGFIPAETPAARRENIPPPQHDPRESPERKLEVSSPALGAGLETGKPYLKNHSGPSPSGPAGGEHSGKGPTFFQVEGRGQSVLFLIDRSSSMGPSGALRVATRELLASLQGLAREVRFQVLVYNTRTNPLLPQYPDWLGATQDNIRRVAQALADLEAAGPTDHGPALREALLRQPDVLFFLTDADDLTSEQVRRANQINRGRTVIHVIELNPFNRGKPDMPLQVLARDNGGSYQAVDLSRYR